MPRKGTQLNAQSHLPGHAQNISLLGVVACVLARVSILLHCAGQIHVPGMGKQPQLNHRISRSWGGVLPRTGLYSPCRFASLVGFLYLFPLRPGRVPFHLKFIFIRRHGPLPVAKHANARRCTAHAPYATMDWCVSICVTICVVSHSKEGP